MGLTGVSECNSIEIEVKIKPMLIVYLLLSLFFALNSSVSSKVDFNFFQNQLGNFVVLACNPETGEGCGEEQPPQQEHHDVSEESRVEQIAQERGVGDDAGAKEAIAYGEYQEAKGETDRACGSGDSEGCNYYSHLALLKEQEYGAYRDYHLSQQGGTRAETQAEQQATSAAEEAAYGELQRSGDFNKAVEAAISKGGGSLPSELRGALIGRIAKAAGVTPQQAIDKAIEVESQRSDATANSIAGAAAFASKASGQGVKEMMEASMKGAAVKDSSLKGQVAAGVAAANASGASREERNRIAIQTAYEKYNTSGLSTVQAEDELGPALAGLQISRQDLEKQLETLGAPHSFANSVGSAWEKFRESSPVASYGFINFDVTSREPIPSQGNSNNAVEPARNRLLELRDYALKHGADSRVFSHLDKILQEGRITILPADELKRRTSSFSSSLTPAGFYDSETDTIVISADYADEPDLILHEAIHRSAYIGNPGHRDWIIEKFGINNASKLEEGVTEAVVVFGLEGRRVYDPEIAVIREEFVEAIQKNSSRSPEYSYAVILEAGLAGNFQRLAEEMGGGDLDKGIKTINEILDRTHKAWEFDIRDEH